MLTTKIIILIAVSAMTGCQGLNCQVDSHSCPEPGHGPCYLVTTTKRRSLVECPKCDGKTQVIDSRAAGGHSWRRRRSCPTCGFRFSTKEVNGEFIHNILLENKTLRQKNQVFERALGLDQSSISHAVKEQIDASGFQIA